MTELRAAAVSTMGEEIVLSPEQYEALSEGTAILDRRLRMAAVGLWLIVLTIIAGTLLIWAGRGFPRAPISFVRGPLGTSAVALTGIVYSTVAVFLAHRLPRNVIAWMLLGIGLGMAVVMPVNLALSDSLRSFRPVPLLPLLLGWAITSVQLPLSGAFLVVVLLLFPSGRPTWRHFRLGAGLAGIGCLLMTLGTMFEPDGLLWYPSLPNPTAAPATFLPILVGARVAGMVCLLLGLAVAATWLVSRYRVADRHERRQLGWVLLGGVAMVVTLGPLFAVRYALGAPDAVGEQLVFVAAIGGVLFPIAVTVAALREHLFGMEGIVARTLVYVPLMAILGGLYTASVMLLQKLFVAFTGNPSDAAVVMATLLLAGALTPVRRSLEGLVERNTRIRTPPSVAADPALQAVLSRLEALEGRIEDLGVAAGIQAVGAGDGAPVAGRKGLGATALQALQLPVHGEGGLPELPIGARPTDIRPTDIRPTAIRRSDLRSAEIPPTSEGLPAEILPTSEGLAARIQPSDPEAVPAKPA